MQMTSATTAAAAGLHALSFGQLFQPVFTVIHRRKAHGIDQKYASTTNPQVYLLLLLLLLSSKKIGDLLTMPR